MEQSTVFITKKRRNRRRKNNRRPRQVAVPQSNFPLIPKSMSVKIKARTYNTYSATSSPVFGRYGLTNFAGQGGSYADSLFGLYRYASVKAVKLTVKAVNMGAEPLILAVAPMPYSWQDGSPTLSEILDVPTVRKTTIGSSTGRDTAQVSNRTTIAAVLGNEYQSARYIMNSSSAASFISDGDQPVWEVAISSFNASTAISARVEYEWEWDVVFYSLDSV